MARFPEMNWTVNNVAEEFKLFKQRTELCFLDNNINDALKQATKIKIAIGNEGLRKINASGLSPGDQNDPEKLWNLFENQLKVKVNFRIHRLELMRYKQKHGETIDDFVNRCRSKAKECDFKADELCERLVELVIASTPIEAFQKDLLEKPKGFSIDNLIENGRKYEAIMAGRQCLQTLDTDANIGAISPLTKKCCGNCGLSHPPKRCPAYKDHCKACGTIGHWAKMCRKTKQTYKTHSPNRGRSNFQSRGRNGSRNWRFRGQSRGRGRDRSTSQHNRKTSVDAVSKDYQPPQDYPGRESEDNIDVRFHSIDTKETNEAFAEVQITCPERSGRATLCLKVDTGACGNVLPLRTLKDMYPTTWKRMITPTSAKLSAYNGTQIPCLGSITMDCRFKQSSWSKQVFYITDVAGPAILGLPACRDLTVVTINEVHHTSHPIRSVRDLQEVYPDRFDTIGDFRGEAVLYLKDDAVPSIDAPRKCSVHIRAKLKTEIDKMEDQGVIRKVQHHTDWCSSLTTSMKKDGSLRLCLDPKRLNNALRRCPHKIPTLEELNPEFSGAQFFSKLDAKSGYWAVHIEKKSKELTTFRTPFSRYCFQRLPFGLSVSQDIFQERMDHIIAQVPGCVGIADDIAIFGRTEAEHDHNLRQLMETARREGLVFNSQKCEIKTDHIEFFGSVYTANGIRPDPKKVEDVHQMPTPQDKDDLQRCLGLFTYMASYIPNYAERASTLRDLLKKDVPFLWQDDHQHAFDELKRSIDPESCLKYFDPREETTLEVDASQKGLGACLLQGGRPIAFASKSLSPAQANYSNIERETLALVFGVTRFHTYLFGKMFTVETDHKPLEMIWKKPLGSAPPRLQRILIKIQGYDCQVRYKPGKNMVISDTLSRLPNPSKRQDVPLDLQVDESYLDVEDYHGVDMTSFEEPKEKQLQDETSRDPVLKVLWKTVVTGWPETIKDLPTSIREFWPFRDEIGISNGVLFKGTRVIIPETIREDIKTQLHQGHMGIDRTRRLARETVYWPGINSDIETLVKSCEACQAHQAGNQKEPLEPHEIPHSPWTKLATDLFMLDGEDYLLITDYYSKYPLIHKLRNTTSETVSAIVSATFSLYGVPLCIVSDNGPQYTGQPFQDMCKKWGIRHTTSSPRYPRSNGMAERNVRTVKSLMKKCKETGQDIQVALLHYRATPLGSNLPSPAELLLGRQIRTTLPSHHLRRHPNSDEVYDNLKKRQEEMKENHDKNAGPNLPPLQIGQRVRCRDKDNSWIPAQVTKVCKEPHSYEIETPNGSTLRRNRSHLRNVPPITTPMRSKETMLPVRKRVRFTEGEVTDPETNPTHLLPKSILRKAGTEERHPNPNTTVTRSGRIIRKPMRYRDT